MHLSQQSPLNTIHHIIHWLHPRTHTEKRLNIIFGMIYLTNNIQKLYNQCDTTIEKYSHRLLVSKRRKSTPIRTVGMQNNVSNNRNHYWNKAENTDKKREKKYLYRPRARHTYNKIVSLSPETTFRIELQTRDTLIGTMVFFFVFRFCLVYTLLPM